ncbi:hypothetical protein VPDG_00047 [Vibrio phage henriette 12B8]|uniref:hypothetical protein n=1 Tax=Vibrio phage henriette 12B8 TaxID=573174 RepID=UPI0002C0B886|nr:hypothetical protein VPDG_00047 [Vibrio phage henriette 12B8]AGG58208.1 hypothetical protein VPDG_00047 [Vibrio phage henriette 12B8]
MKLAIVNMYNKVGQEYKEYYLSPDIHHHGAVKLRVFNEKRVYDYDQPNDNGNYISSITLSDDLDFLFDTGDDLKQIVIGSLG